MVKTIEATAKTKDKLSAAPVVQPGSEHLPYKQGVIGSNPIGSTKN